MSSQGQGFWGFMKTWSTLKLHSAIKRDTRLGFSDTSPEDDWNPCLTWDWRFNQFSKKEKENGFLDVWRLFKWNVAIASLNLRLNREKVFRTACLLTTSDFTLPFRVWVSKPLIHYCAFYYNSTRQERKDRFTCHFILKQLTHHALSVIKCVNLWHESKRSSRCTSIIPYKNPV